MFVAELIEKLKALPQGATVVTIRFDEDETPIVNEVMKVDYDALTFRVELK